MRREILISTAALVLAALGPSPAAAQGTVYYAIAIGNNAPPQEGLATLKYADDDAVRLALFFRRFASKVELLTVPDAETRATYPEIADRSGTLVPRSPTLEGLRSAIRDLAPLVQRDKSQGSEVALYVTFSGHGGQTSDGIPFLAMERGQLTQKVISEEILNQLPDIFVHLFIDACNAEALVGARGVSGESDSKTVPIFPAAIPLPSLGWSQQYSKLGVLLAATTRQEVHEWDAFHSGIFTHELLSGFEGAADVNNDGWVEYSEIQAFVNSTNGAMPNPGVRLQVYSYPPLADPRIHIVSRSLLRDVALLSGDFSSFGHFNVQWGNGERYLDANLSGGSPAWIALPVGGDVCIRTDTFEAEVHPSPGQALRVSELPRGGTCGATTSKRGLGAEFARSLFKLPFGCAFYQGVVTGLRLLPVELDDACGAGRNGAGGIGGGGASSGSSSGGTGGTGGISGSGGTGGISSSGGSEGKRSVAPSILLLAGSAVFLASSAWKGASAIQAKHDYDSTSFQRAASDAQRRYHDDGITAIWTGGVAIGFGIVAWLAWPSSHPRPIAVAPLTVNGGPGIALQGVW